MAVATHCPYCALQCGMHLRVAGERVSIERRDFPTNRGGLCQKGWTAAELLDSPERLRGMEEASRRLGITPRSLRYLMRKHGLSDPVPSDKN